MDIKKELLDRHLVEENIYLDKYVQLVENNITANAIKYCTQKHHIIPVCAYKVCCQKVNNRKENLVNLLYKDHILAHYYLSLCGTGLFKHYNEEAFLYLIRTNNSNANREPFDTKNLEYYQSLYESAMKYVAERTRAALTGRKQSEKQIQDRVRKNTGQKRSEETRLKMSEWQVGIPKRKESVEKTREALKSLINITDGVKNKRVKESELEYYYSLGFYKGYTSKSLPKRKLVNNGIEEKYVELSEVDTYLSNNWKLGRCSPGMPRSEVWKSNISKALKGRTFTQEHRDNISKAASSIVRAPRLGPSKNKGRIWVNNNEVEKMIYSQEIEEFLSRGYTKGRLKHNQ